MSDATAITFAPGGGADLDGIRALLERLGLPARDVGAENQRFIVARSGDALVGCVGLESYGGDAILRSLAVAPELQGSGLGKALHGRALAEADRSGVQVLYLLTTTAEGFFARAGYARVDRARVPPAIADSPEFQSLCPASAACMAKPVR